MKLSLTARTFGICLTAMLLFATVFTAGLSVVSFTSESQSTQLGTLIEVASSSQTYAIAIVKTASQQGLNTANFDSLIALGNHSLEVARSDYLANANLSFAIQEVSIAMSYFTNASVGASVFLQNSNTTLRISADLDSVASANATLSSANSVIGTACEIQPTNSSYVSQFDNDCSTSKIAIKSALADLNEASSLLLTAESSQSQINLNQSESLIEGAKGNISLASATILQLSAFSYSTRAQEFVSGPLAQLLGFANRTVSTQRNLFASLGSTISSYQSFSSQQGTAVSSIEASASAASSDVSSTITTMSSVSSATSDELSTLSQALSDMSQFSNSISTLNLGSDVTLLQADISSVQAAMNTASSSAETLQIQSNSFGQTSLDSLSSYSTGFGTNVTSTNSNNQAVLSALATLQADLDTVVATFPLPTLLQWQSTLSTLNQSLNSIVTSVSSSCQTAVSNLTSTQASINSLQSSIQSSQTQIEVGSSLISSLSSIESSEELYLNATAYSQLASALSSLQTTSTLASNFVSSAKSILTISAGEFSNSVQSLSSNGNELNSQSASTLSAMKNAQAFVSSDLEIRSNALISANQDISQALVMFGDLKIPEGASLLVQANFLLSVASEPS